MDIHAYRAKQFREAIDGKPIVQDEDYVLQLLQNKNQFMKKEEIIEHVMRHVNMDYDDAAGFVGYALSKLVKDKKVDRLERGIYCARNKR